MNTARTINREHIASAARKTLKNMLELSVAGWAPEMEASDATILAGQSA